MVSVSFVDSVWAWITWRLHTLWHSGEGLNLEENRRLGSTVKEKLRFIFILTSEWCDIGFLTGSQKQIGVFDKWRDAMRVSKLRRKSGVSVSPESFKSYKTVLNFWLMRVHWFEWSILAIVWSVFCMLWSLHSFQEAIWIFELPSKLNKYILDLWFPIWFWGLKKCLSFHLNALILSLAFRALVS